MRRLSRCARRLEVQTIRLCPVSSRSFVRPSGRLTIRFITHRTPDRKQGGDQWSTRQDLCVGMCNAAYSDLPVSCEVMCKYVAKESGKKLPCHAASFCRYTRSELDRELRPAGNVTNDVLCACACTCVIHFRFARLAAFFAISDNVVSRRRTSVESSTRRSVRVGRKI